MNSDRWQQINRLFEAAIELAPNERSEFVNEVCQKDESLREELESLLASHAEAENFLEKPAVGEVAEAVLEISHNLKKNQIIGHYRILAELGKGGQGAVFKALDIKLNRTVALKTLPPDLTADETSRRRFQREAQLASALDHPNICTVHDLTEIEGTYFIVMQFVEGETLADKLAHGRLNIRETLDLAIQIADALGEAHAQNIIHRDIKPSNIIVNKKGNAKVLDFGLAKSVEARSEDESAKLLSASGAVMGTVPYMSPEQVRGKKLDARTDIFSFGVMLYEMLSGQKPFARENNAEIIAAILIDEPPLTRIPVEFQPIVQKSLMKDKEKRYQTAKDLLADLKNLRQKLKSDGKLKNTAPPDTDQSEITRTTAQTNEIHTTSSAEYIVTQIKSHKRAAITTLTVLIVAAAALGYVGYRLLQSFQVERVSAERTLTQLTFGAGLQSEPTWSPDGRFIAYSAESGGNFDIWVQQVSGGNPVQVTKSAAHDWQPDWSPDGNSLVFRSERNNGGLFVVPVLGGNERKISSFGYRPQWASDGSRVLFYNSNLQNVTAPPKIYVVDLNGTLPREVLADLTGEFPGRLRVAWHPDGQRISLWGEHRQQGLSFWTISLSGGEPIKSEFSPQVIQQIKDAAVDLFDFRWAANARTLYFEGISKGVRNLWKVETDPQTLRWISGLERLTTGAGLDTDIALSMDGRKLAFTTRAERIRLWSLPLNAATGKTAGAGQPVTPPGLNALGCDLTRDGKKLAFILQRGERRELWEKSFADGSEKLLVTADDFIPTAPRWSRNGSRLAFARNNLPGPNQSRQYTHNLEHAIALLNVDGSGEQPLTSPHSLQGWAWDWSADEINILGSSARQTPGNWGLFLFPIAAAPQAENQARLITARPEYDAFNARFSPDERWICFIAINKTDLGDAAIYVVPAEGGEWVRVTEGKFYDDKPRWSPDGRMLYFLSNRSGFFNVWGIRFDSNTGQPVGEAFRVTNLENPGQMIPSMMTQIEMSLAAERLIVPIMEVSGNVWILENVER